MADQRKTFIVLATIAAAVGVYAEMSYQEKLKDADELRALRAAAKPSGTAAKAGAPEPSARP